MELFPDKFNADSAFFSKWVGTFSRVGFLDRGIAATTSAAAVLLFFDEILVPLVPTVKAVPCVRQSEGAMVRSPLVQLQSAVNVMHHLKVSIFWMPRISVQLFEVFLYSCE